MNNKILMITAALVVMLAMTGIVAADPAEMDIAATEFSIGGGNVDESTVLVYDIDYASFGDHDRTLTAVTSISTVQVRVCDVQGDEDCTGATYDTDWSPDNDPTTTGHQFTYPAVSPNTYTFYVYVKGTTDGQITLFDNEGTDYTYLGGHDIADASVGAFIPEFSTIALPIAAVLGLVFFFQQRKNKKE